MTALSMVQRKGIEMPSKKKEPLKPGFATDGLPLEETAAGPKEPEGPDPKDAEEPKAKKGKAKKGKAKKGKAKGQPMSQAFW